MGGRLLSGISWATVSSLLGNVPVFFEGDPRIRNLPVMIFVLVHKCEKGF
jgi:hypothetical protein